MCVFVCEHIHPYIHAIYLYVRIMSVCIVWRNGQLHSCSHFPNVVTIIGHHFVTGNKLDIFTLHYKLGIVRNHWTYRVVCTVGTHALLRTQWIAPMLQMSVQDLRHLPSGRVKVIKFALWSIELTYIPVIEFTVCGFSQSGLMTWNAFLLSVWSMV